MSNAAIGAAVVLGGIALVGLWFAGNFNGLVASRNQVDKSWATVETQYQRRLDLIGNLVSSVKGAQKQEVAVFTAIADARKQYINAVGPSEKAAAANVLETNVSLIPRLQEAYPELKSNTQVTKLMDQLTGTEDGIQGSRDAYNKVANNYNTQIQSFPKMIFAKTFGFTPRALFKSQAGAETAPKVEF